MSRQSASVVASFSAKTLNYNREILKAVQANKELLNSMIKLKKETRQTNTQNTNASRTFRNMALRITALIVTVKKLTEHMLKLSDASSRAEEIQQKFDIVFRHNRAEVQEWANELAEATDRSSTNIEAFAAHLQNTFVPLGFAREQATDLSKGLVELAQDLSSFNDIPTERVINDIRAALLGNVRAVRKYGVSANEAAIFQEALTQGWVTEKKQIDAVIKANAINNIILRSTRDAHNDLTRTMHQTANVRRAYNEQVERSRELLGDYVNLFLTPIRAGLVQIIEKWNKAREAAVSYLKFVKFGDETADIELAIKGAIDLLDEQNEIIKNTEVMSIVDEHLLQIAIDKRDVLREELKDLVAKREILREQEAAIGRTLKEEEDRRKLEKEAFDASQKEDDRQLRISAKLMENSTKMQDSIKEGEKELQALREQGAQDDLDNIALRKQATEDFYKSIPSTVASVFSSLAGLANALGIQELNQFEWKNEQEQKIRDDAFDAERSRLEASIEDAELRNNALVALDEERATSEAEIQEKLEVNRREMQYKSALAAWNLNLLGTVAAGAQAQINAWTQTPFILPVAIASSGLAATLTTASLGTIAASRPVKNFQTGTRGFTVPEGFSNDTFGIGLSSGESIVVQTPSQQAGSESELESGSVIDVTMMWDSSVVGHVVQKVIRGRKTIIRMEDIK